MSLGAHIFRVYPELEVDCTDDTGKPGFSAEYYKTPTIEGKPFRVENFPRGYFTTMMNTHVVGTQSVRFSTTFTPSVAGTHYLSFSGIGPSKLWIDGELVANQEESTRDAMSFFLGVQDEIRFQYPFHSNQSYKFVVETHPSPPGNAELYLMENQTSIHLGFITQAEMEHDVLAEAIGIARDADLAICFVGNTTQWETEGQDMSSMTLPADGSQTRLISSIAAVNPNTVVVSTTGVPFETPWLGDVTAFVQAWYAGQESGNAIVDVLLGDVCPSGKLPISWPKRYEDSGCFGNFGLDSYESREVEYVEGVEVGYRWFDRYWGGDTEVGFAFGYGLSYTTFEISGAKVEGRIGNEADARVTVTTRVRNMGQVAGAETVQVYLQSPIVDGLDRPVKELVGFDKVNLQPGEEREARVVFGREGAAYWDEERGQWKVARGKAKVLVATSSRPEDVVARLDVDVEEEFWFGP